MHDLAVQSLAHAVEALELIGPIAGNCGNPRDRVRVMRGELRIKAVGPRQQRARSREIGDVGIDLTGEHRIAGEPRFLRPFDLAVPIGALDQANGDASASGLRDRGEPVDQLQRPLAVGLHREPEPVPPRQSRIGEQRPEQCERKIEPVGLLGVDGELAATPGASDAPAPRGAAPARPLAVPAAKADSAGEAPRA